MKRVAIVGTGYVGLVTGTCLAELGNVVTCIDVVAEKVAMMQAGRIPIYEPGLEELFIRNIAEDRLRFTTDLAAGVKGAEVIFLALPTPSAADGSADLSYIYAVADQLGGLLRQYTVIIDKSTVPVGTAEQIRQRIMARAPQECDVISNPEFLREGLAVRDFMEPERIVIGTASSHAKKVMQELYEPLTRSGSPLLFMSERSAELTKYAANAFLATKITFMNQIANLCEELDADVDEVRKGVGSDSRIGHRFLYPGIGYGGSCFPKDVLALIHMAEACGYDLELLKTVIRNNYDQQQLLVTKILSYYDGAVAGKTFALWGLAFKPETDDIREAPSQGIIKALTEAGAIVRAFDPQAIAATRKVFGAQPNLQFAASEYDALNGADALLIATEWPQFSSASKKRIKQLLVAPVIFDGRNIFTPDDMRAAGFYYESIGRPIVTPKAN